MESFPLRDVADSGLMEYTDRFTVSDRLHRECGMSKYSSVTIRRPGKFHQWTRLFLVLVLLVVGGIEASQCVYLIHGFGSNRLSMSKIGRSLRKNGFTVVNYGYNSLYKDLDTLGSELSREVAALTEDTVSFVTHSMGALVVRSMYRFIDTTARFPAVNRIVMIAPPNKGAEIADFFSSSRIISLIMGPNLEKMRTDSGSYVNRLPKPRFGEVGVIIAVQRRRPWFDRTSSPISDGFLTPARTTMGTEKEIAVIPSSHVLVTMKRPTVKLVLRFIRKGSFKRSQ